MENFQIINTCTAEKKKKQSCKKSQEGWGEGVGWVGNGVSAFYHHYFDDQC